jgi:hypothetical protein
MNLASTHTELNPTQLKPKNWVGDTEDQPSYPIVKASASELVV